MSLALDTLRTIRGWINTPFGRINLEKLLRREGDVLHFNLIGEGLEECPFCYFSAGDCGYKIRDFVETINFLRVLFGVRVVRIHHPGYFHEGRAVMVNITKEDFVTPWYSLHVPDSGCIVFPCFEGVEWQPELSDKRK